MQIQIEKPRLAIPAALLVDDATPIINPLYYFRLQVDRERYEHHERCIPLDFMEQFVEVCQTRGIRGKFTILPYPAGLGDILQGWEGCDRRELEGWLELARTGLTPLFDITPEILTHTLALDLQTRTLIPESEHDWMAKRTRAELVEYMSAALTLLKKAGFHPNGITQPCYFNGSREDYTEAVREAVREAGGPPATFYFIDGYLEGVPAPPPPVMLLDRQRGEAVLSIWDYAHEFFWRTQRPDSHQADRVADQFITADGQSGRLVDLAQSGSWLVFCCHWQSLYSDGSRQGLAALDRVAERLSKIYGPRLLWLTISEIARYRAASEGCQITPLPGADGLAFSLDSALDCPDFTFTLQSPELAGARVGQVSWQVAGETPQDLAQVDGGEGLLSPGVWWQREDRLSICCRLQRGAQILHVHRG